MDQERWADFGFGIFVSSLGRVKRYGRIFIPETVCDGYRHMYVRNKRLKLHYMILTAFVGPRPNRKVGRHLDGNRLNNRLTNLRWGTNADNHKDAVEHGTHSGFLNRGTGNLFAKLNDDSVRDIREAYKNGAKPSKLAKIHGVTPWTINSIVHRRTWRHI